MEVKNGGMKRENCRERKKEERKSGGGGGPCGGYMNRT